MVLSRCFCLTLMFGIWLMLCIYIYISISWYIRDQCPYIWYSLYIRREGVVKRLSNSSCVPSCSVTVLLTTGPQNSTSTRQRSSLTIATFVYCPLKRLKWSPNDTSLKLNCYYGMLTLLLCVVLQSYRKLAKEYHPDKSLLFCVFFNEEYIFPLKYVQDWLNYLSLASLCNINEYLNKLELFWHSFHNHNCLLFLSSSRRLVLHTKYWPTPRRRSSMIAMESRDYERELVVEGQAWMISSLTSLVEGCSASWGGKGAEGGGGGEAERRGYGAPPQVSWHKAPEWMLKLLLSIFFGVNQRMWSCLFGRLTRFVICHRVSLEDMYNGKTTKLQLSKNVLCSSCNGWVLFD